jgi:hypothetical protein
MNKFDLKKQKDLFIENGSLIYKIIINLNKSS